MDIGKSEGAVLVCGGERVKRKTEGNFLTPALFVDTHNEMRINREEIFGPIASVIKVKDYDEALAVANDTDFGLSAGIVTTSLNMQHTSKSTLNQELHRLIYPRQVLIIMFLLEEQNFQVMAQENKDNMPRSFTPQSRQHTQLLEF